jgi:hypothetical protein
MIVDCMTCPVRGRRCEDCAVTVLLASGSAELLLDAAESRAVSMFVGAGLVNAWAAAGLRARRESVEHRGAFRDVG